MLILVNGMPATGKTTLARKLSADLRLPLITKDMLKEYLFDTFGVGDREWSRHIGVAASRMLYIVLEEFLVMGRPLIIESAFDARFAQREIGRLLEKYGVPCVEVYCSTDHSIRMERFVKRALSGERHPGHVDEQNARQFDMQTIQTDIARYAPLNLGELISVDTTEFDPADYDRVRTALEHIMNVSV